MSMELNLKITKIDEDLELPQYANEDDAGLDLRSSVDAIISPFSRCMIPCGIAIAIPQGYAGLVIPRSGLAARHGITVLNAPGLIDSGYRGEIGVVLHNTDPNQAFTVSRGDRIAQLMLVEIPRIRLEIANSLDTTSRGVAGFGSTGL